MSGTLFVVATPIGNLNDLSPRAVDTLKTVDLIACEDTRHTGNLLRHFGIDRPTVSYHEHNEEQRTPGLLEKLRSGSSVALVSDAGTPLLSDPGYRLVRLAREDGVRIIPVPGPFAGATAVSVSGLGTDQVLFVGFLPKKLSSQRKVLVRLARQPATMVFYLSPHQLEKIFRLLCEAFGDREAFLIREMTKLYETSYWGTLDSISNQLAEEKAIGEYTLVVAGASGAGEPVLELDAEAYVSGLVALRGLSRSDAVKRASDELKIPKRELYRRVSLETWKPGNLDRE